MSLGLGKSLLLAVGATGTSFAAVTIAGLLSNGALMDMSKDEAADDPALRTVIMEPVPVDRRGYSLKAAKTGDQVFVSVQMTVTKPKDRARVCKLMPRLVASVLRDLGPVVWKAPRNATLEGPDVDAFVRRLFTRELGGNPIEAATVRITDDVRRAPRPNCNEALPGAWKSLITKDTLRNLRNDR